MRFTLILLSLIPIVCFGQSENYLDYYYKIIEAEENIVARQFDESLKIYRNLTDTYEHVFLRDLKIAAQLSAHINDGVNLYYFLEKGMKKGWTSKLKIASTWNLGRKSKKCLPKIKKEQSGLR